MTFPVKTIPGMPVGAYGNQTKAAHELRCSCCAVRKYVDDEGRKVRAIVNDILMAHHEWSKRDALLRKN